MKLFAIYVGDIYDADKAFALDEVVAGPLHIHLFQAAIARPLEFTCR